MKRVRKPAVAGMFYPADAKELERTVLSLLNGVLAHASQGMVVGIVAPHAGYMYSGATAALAYAQVRGTTRKHVVVVSPSHREFFDGVSVYPGDGYETPLGVVHVAAELRERLTKAMPGLLVSTNGHGTEHALEVHLPFLQCAIGEFTLLPLVIGHQSLEHCLALGDALGAICEGTDTLLVASTDLSHFSPAAIAQQLDAVVARDIEALDPVRLMHDLEEGAAEACGGGPVSAVMRACDLLGARLPVVLGHSHSGMVTGDDQSVVGYLSAVIRKN
jgi:MEMO1 family protein